MWRKCTMRSAILWATMRRVAAANLQARPDGAEPDEDFVVFTDGSAVAVHSVWKGPYSEVTPDIDAQDPGWRIYEPTKEKR